MTVRQRRRSPRRAVIEAGRRAVAHPPFSITVLTIDVVVIIGLWAYGIRS